MYDILYIRKVILMNMAEIERIVYRQLEAGLIHHSYDNETRAYALLSMDPEELVRFLNRDTFFDSMEMYTTLLGPTRIRSIKNGLISYLTLVCRTAIRAGVSTEFSYGLSDFYINYMETLKSEPELIQLIKDITLHYNSLIHRGTRSQYSKPVASALRMMHQHLYETCKVKDIAAGVGLEVHYFSSLFKRETGMSPGKYLNDLKMAEAARLLSLRENTVTYVATSLGYNDVAHFSKAFKKQYGISPKNYSLQDRLVP